MQLQITGHQIEVTPALRTFIEEKTQKLKRHTDKVMNGHYILEVNKQVQMAEASIHCAGYDIHAKAESEDMYKSIDMLIDKLDRQIIKHREKETTHR